MIALLTEIAGLGFTVMVNEVEFPVQPFREGLTVMVDVIGTPVLLVKMNEGIFPVPEAARPIVVLLNATVLNQVSILNEPVMLLGFAAVVVANVSVI